MGLKITTQIGTDKGITNEAYVRIADYQISKHGSANLRIELFQSQGDVPVVGGAHPAMNGGQSHNQQIGDTLWVPLTKEVEQTRTTLRNVEIDVPAEGEVGQEGYMPATKRWEMQEVEESLTSIVPDLSQLEDGTIFAFGYGKLKEKLVTLFGAENVVDC